MKTAIRHLTQYAYSPAASRAALRLRLFPPQFEGQRVTHWSVSVNGTPIEPLHVGAFGEAEAIWTTRNAQSELVIMAAGEVETHDTAGVVRGLQDYSRPGVFLRQTALTAPDDGIRDMARLAQRPTPLDTCHVLSALISDTVAYRKDKTSSATAAAAALALGEGVCQDHAHIFIAAARAIGLPARYVMGYMAADNDLHETHAWAEAYVPELSAWVGFDPTNRQCPTAAYIRLGCGFDAAGAAPVKGCVGPGTTEALVAEVSATPSMVQEQ